MKRRFSLLAILLAPMLAARGEAPPAGVPDTFLQKKLIALGWDSPSPEELLTNLKAVEQTPFDGVRIQIEKTTGDGRRVSLRRMFNAEPWQREWFADDIETLKRARSAKLTDNFLMTGPGPAVDWFDDVGWRQVVEHFRIAAWIARQSGLKGLVFDPEISGGQPAFAYNCQPGVNEHSFAEYAAKARERGRQMMEAVGEEYPDITFFTLFLNGGLTYAPVLREGGPDGDLRWFYLDAGEVKPAGPTTPQEVVEQMAPRDQIERGSYNLLSAFANGWLDASKPGMTFVDGLEQTYTATKRESLLHWANAVRNTALVLVAPENRAKYRAQVQAGFGIYLDAYVNPPGSKYFIGLPEGYSGRADGAEATAARMATLAAIMREAAKATDEYVWVWGEKYRWWPTQEKKVLPQTWEEASPGITDALRQAFHLGERHAAQLRQAQARWAEITASGKGGNLLTDGAFASGAVTGWTHGQPESFTFDGSTGRAQAGSLRVEGSKEGLGQLTVILNNKKPDYYGIRGWVRQSEGTTPRIRVRWQTAAGEFSARGSDNIYFTPVASQRPGDWQRFEGIVVLPGKVNLVLQLGASGPGSVWYDDLEVTKIDLPSTDNP